MLFLPISLRSILILYSHVCTGHPSVLFPTGYPTQTLSALLTFPVRAISRTLLIFLGFISQIIFYEEYDYEASRQFTQVPCEHISVSLKCLPQHPTHERSSASVLLSVRETNFHTHIKQQETLNFCIFNL
jgi:hypothetical protein